MTATPDSESGRTRPAAIAVVWGIALLLLALFVCQGTVEVRTPPSVVGGVFVNGVPAIPSGPGVFRTGRLMIGEYPVEIRDSPRGEWKATAFAWLSERVVVDATSLGGDPTASTAQSGTSATRPASAAGVSDSTAARTADSTTSPAQVENPTAEAPTDPTSSEAAVRSATLSAHGHEIEVRLSNVDDREKVIVNGTDVLVAGYQEDTGWRNLTSNCHAGPNQLELQLWNDGSGYTYGFEVRVDGKMVSSDIAGQAGSVGANNNDDRGGMVFRKVIQFNLE